MNSPNQELVLLTAPYDVELKQFESALTRRQANRCKLLIWIRENLMDTVDFGRIHVVGKTKCNQGKLCKIEGHYSKPILFKPGAEKICGMLGVIPRYPNLPEYERAVMQGVELKSIVLHCELQNAAGQVLADGVGARSLLQDGGDLNKALKMAEKSAHIDATLRLAGLSELFSQDMDDSTHKDEGEGDPIYMVTATQLKKLQTRLQGYDLPQERVLKWCKAKWGIEQVEALTYEQFQELDAKLEAFAEKVKAERSQEPVSADQLRKVMSFAVQHSIEFTTALRRAGINSMEQLTYSTLDALWKVLESSAERKAIQSETPPVIQVDPNSDAGKLFARAKQLRTDARFCDGQSYYRELEEARNLEVAARKLLADEQATSGTSEEASS